MQMEWLAQANAAIGTLVALLVTIGGLCTQARKIRDWLFGDIIKDLRQTHLAVLRVELLTNIYNTPERAAVIEALFEEYKQLGGNHYIEEVMAAWRDAYEKQVLERRIRRANDAKGN